MIDRIIVRNFKSLRAIDLSLGRRNLFIGANSSGKSNFLEVFRVLQGIGRGLSICKVLDGGQGDETTGNWRGIRGGSAKACSIGSLRENQGVMIQACGRFSNSVSDGWDFAITFTPSNGHVVRESLRVGSETLYSIEKSSMPYIGQFSDQVGMPHPTQEYTDNRQCSGKVRETIANPSHNVSTIQENADGDAIDKRAFWKCSDSALATLVARALSNVQQLDPLPHIIREHSESNQVDRMGDHGEGFMALVHAIYRDDDTRDQYLSWMREFSSPGGGEITSSQPSLSETLFKSSRVGSSTAWAALSDGTLRFAALVAALLQTNLPEILLLDEIETSIHAGQIRLLVELLEPRSDRFATQVIATTHSPVVLEWLKHTSLANTFFCNRDYDTGESVIRPLLEVPKSEDTLLKGHFFDVLTERWLELMS